MMKSLMCSKRWYLSYIEVVKRGSWVGSNFIILDLKVKLFFRSPSTGKKLYHIHWLLFWAKQRIREASQVKISALNAKKHEFNKEKKKRLSSWIWLRRAIKKMLTLWIFVVSYREWYTYTEGKRIKDNEF